MSIHIGAEPGQVADTVLLPGDPLRAKHVAETMLENAVPYNKVRGMYGYTGTYKGKRISVQGTGMGIPSISIYVNELIAEYGAKNLIRIGTCGALQPDLRGPTSQPVAVDLAFSVLDALGAFDSVIVDKALEFLSSITRLDGGVPVALPTVADRSKTRTCLGSSVSDSSHTIPRSRSLKL